MKKTIRIAKARETVEILESGYYQVSGRMISVKDKLKATADNSQLYRPKDLAELLAGVGTILPELKITPKITVENCTVLAAAEVMDPGRGKIGCLNFASAKNPGGGFLNGAQAQEESIAMSSGLYASQLQHFEMYQYNRAQHTFLYSDYRSYSPDTVVFRDEHGELLDEPYSLSIITSPAVNVGAMKANKPDELDDVERVMLERMDKVLAVFVQHGIKRLLLGAWGCGVFQNEPAQIARWFAHYLTGSGKYAHAFGEVFFAVYDRSAAQENINAFTQQFS